MSYTVITKTHTWKAAAIIPSDSVAHVYAYCNDGTTLMPISVTIQNNDILSVTDETGKDYTSYIKD